MLDINVRRALIITKENIWWLNQNIGFYLDWVNQIRKKHNKSYYMPIFMINVEYTIYQADAQK
jgi:hypothetical protein